MPTDTTQLTAVLAWIIAGPGAVWLANYAISILVENWKTWGSLPTFVKVLTPILLAIVLGVGAQFLLTAPELISQIQPWFALVMTIIVGYIGSQSGYMKAKSAGYGARFKSSAANEDIRVAKENAKG